MISTRRKVWSASVLISVGMLLPSRLALATRAFIQVQKRIVQAAKTGSTTTTTAISSPGSSARTPTFAKVFDMGKLH